MFRILFLVILAASAARADTFDQVLDAIRMVESSGRVDVPDGDNGKAIGPYQIHAAYWSDAVAFDKTLDGGYQDCRDAAYARRVVRAYMARYARAAIADPQAVDAERIARVHNGGPAGPRNPRTLPYWRKVRDCLQGP